MTQNTATPGDDRTPDTKAPADKPAASGDAHARATPSGKAATLPQPPVLHTAGNPPASRPTATGS
jgi:hypothetical protein